MIRLLRAELRRFVSRDVVRMFAVAVLIAIAIGSTIAAVNSKIKPPDEAAYRSELQRCLDGAYVPENQLPRRYGTLEEFCAEQVRPEYFGGGDQRFPLSELPDILQGAGILVVIGGLLLGASFAGAEWHAGTMTTLLTWEPRRVRVLAAKAIVTAAAVFVLMVLLLAVFAGALTLVASTRGITDHLGDHFVRSVVGTVAAGGGVLVGGRHRRPGHRDAGAQHGGGDRHRVRVPRRHRGPDPGAAARLAALPAGRQHRGRGDGRPTAASCGSR